MICPRCQTQNIAGARFCTSCGYDLATPSTPSAPVTLPSALSVRPPRPAISSTLSQPPPALPQPPLPQPPIAQSNFPLPTLPQSIPTVPLAPAPGMPGVPARSPRDNMRRALLIGAAVLVLLAGAGSGAFFFLRPPRTQQDARAGRWVSIATAAPGQPAPTVPPGAYAFTDPGGNLVIYYPPSQAPVAVTWQTYHDAQHGYQLDLPGNWTQRDQSPALAGARMVCPPGADTQQDEPGAPECVTYGWVASFTLPAPSDPGVADLHAISAGGVSGTLYTESSLGTIITAVFPSGGGDVVITTFGNSDALMYAFAHMLATLAFS